MNTLNTLIDPTSKKEGETRTIVVPFIDKLREDETLTGTPTVAELNTAALTITDIGVTGQDVTIRGQTIEAGKAVQFSVSGGTARNDYTIRVRASGNTSPTQTLEYDMRLHVI